MDSSIAGLGLDVFSNMLKMGYGAFQMGKGELGLHNLKRPEYTIDKNILQNKQLAGQYASQGFGSSFLNTTGDAVDRNLGSTIGAYTQTGQGLNAISGAQQNSNNAFQQLLMADAQQKAKNRGVLLDANKDLAEENLRSFNWNKAIPFQQDYTKFTNMVNSGSQNMFGGAKGASADTVAAGDSFGNKMGSGGSSDMQEFFKVYQMWKQSQQGDNGFGDYTGSLNSFNIG